MRGICSIIRLLALALGIGLPLAPSLIHGQQDEENKASKAKSTAKKETKQAGQKAPPPQKKEKDEEKKSEEKPQEELKAWVETLPYRVLPPIGMWPVEPSGPWFYSLADVFLDRVNFKPPPSPYGRFGLFARPFFDVSLEYLRQQSKAQEPISIFDPLHPLYADDVFLLSMGGEMRWRYMNRENGRLNNKGDTYDLTRQRLYADLWISDVFRVYAELLSAQTMFQDLPPLPGNQNLTTLLNAFLEAKLANVADAPVYARVGRQELLFGSQRLISPLPWINTLRTFDGARIYRASEKFDVDIFWVQPAFPSAPAATATFLDHNQSFAGAWATYRPNTDTFIDAYYLFLDGVPPLDTNFLGPKPPTVNTTDTIGLAYRGKQGGFLWDTEQMFQTGLFNGRPILADATTVGAGYHFADALFHPTLWVYYDYASGSQNPTGSGTYSTFNQLFPFSHYYLGWLDLVARQNIEDFNVHLRFYPTKWFQLWTQYHHFDLANAHDALYAASGKPLVRDPTGAAGRNVGDELDFIANFHLSATTDLLLGYSQFFVGRFLIHTGTKIAPDQFFLQYAARF